MNGEPQHERSAPFHASRGVDGISEQLEPGTFALKNTSGDRALTNSLDEEKDDDKQQSLVWEGKYARTLSTKAYRVQAKAHGQFTRIRPKTCFEEGYKLVHFGHALSGEASRDKQEQFNQKGG